MGGAKKEFTASEAETIAESFRDLAKRLNCLAEEILAVKDIDYRSVGAGKLRYKHKIRQTNFDIIVMTVIFLRYWPSA